jgi:outer membrane protein assembly factor BamB
VESNDTRNGHVRLLASLVGALVAVVLLAPPSSASSRAPRWTQLGSDAGRTGSNPAESTLTASNAPDLEVAWVRDSWRAGPVFAGDSGYVGAGIFDPATGDDLGALDAGPAEDASSALVGGTLVTTAWDDPILYALDASSGELLWDKPWADAGTSPTVGRGKIFTTANGTIRAIDPAGRLQWKRRVAPDRAGEPVVSNGRVFVLVALDEPSASGTHKLVALHSSTGDIVWKRKVAYSSISIRWVVASDGMVLTARAGKLVALDAADGSTLWSSDAGCCRHAPALGEGKVFTTQWTPAGNELFALDASSGETLWSKRGSDISDGLTIANGVVYQAAMGLEAYDAATGEELLDLDIGVPWSAPVVWNGSVYLPIENGPHDAPATGEGLYAFRLP